MAAVPMAACGGCAAKVSGDVLRSVLGRLELPRDPRVVAGLEAPDDAAVLLHPAGAHVVCTADFFPPFSDDAYVVGEVAAVNAAGDLYAMGAEPRAALALVSLPAGSDTETEETLELLLRGAVVKLREMGIALVGGHTIEGDGLLFGFSMTGSCAPESLLRKGGAQPGDALVLTKPLGTGVVLAAARAAKAPADWTDAAIESMLRSNREAATLLRSAGAHACTDVTGFGLAGHLLEMLRASGCGAEIEVRACPPYRELSSFSTPGFAARSMSATARTASMSESAEWRPERHESSCCSTRRPPGNARGGSSESHGRPPRCALRQRNDLCRDRRHQKRAQRDRADRWRAVSGGDPVGRIPTLACPHRYIY